MVSEIELFECTVAKLLIRKIYYALFLIFIVQVTNLLVYNKLAEISGVARVDHRTKCVSMVAISLSHIFVTTNFCPAV
jgi:hypothetical protein